MTADAGSRKLLFRRLLDEVAARLRARNPSVDRLLLDAGDIDETILGAPIQPYTSLLTALFDVEIGIDTFEFMIERASTTSDPREWDIVTNLSAVALAAIPERLEDLLKIFQRRRICTRQILAPFFNSIEVFRTENELLFGLRNQTAHSVQGHILAFSRVPEMTRAWDLQALFPREINLLRLGGRTGPIRNREAVTDSMRATLVRVTVLADEVCTTLATVDWRS